MMFKLMADVVAMKKPAYWSQIKPCKVRLICDACLGKKKKQNSWRSQLDTKMKSPFLLVTKN